MKNNRGKTLTTDLERNSAVYRECLAEREEIDRYHWLESGKLGSTIGSDCAWLRWILNLAIHSGTVVESRDLIYLFQKRKALSEQRVGVF